MTENEEQAVKWMKSVRDDAVAILDYIAKNEPNVSPMLYAGRKEKAGVIIKGFEELERYRAIGTVEECREAMEGQRAKKPIILREQSAESEGKLYIAKYFKCPNCGNTSKYFGGLPNNCHNCGQALDGDTP